MCGHAQFPRAASACHTDAPRASRPLDVARVSEPSLGVSRHGAKAYHGIDQLDTVVFRRVVAGRDHHADRLATHLPRTQRCEQAHTEDHRVQQVSACRAGSSASGRLPVRTTQPQLSWGVPARRRSMTTRACLRLHAELDRASHQLGVDVDGRLTPAVPYWKVWSAGLACLTEALMIFSWRAMAHAHGRHEADRLLVPLMTP